MYIAWITLHVIKVGSNWNSNLQSFSAWLYFVQYYVHLCNNKKDGGGFQRLWYYTVIMNQVYSACVVQYTIQVFHHYYKSEILRYDNILDIKRTLYICFIFPLPLTMIIRFYGEYIVHLHCQWKRREIHTKTVYICFTEMYVFSVSFRFPFRSVFRSAF